MYFSGGVFKLFDCEIVERFSESKTNLFFGDVCSLLFCGTAEEILTRGDGGLLSTGTVFEVHVHAESFYCFTVKEINSVRDFLIYSFEGVFNAFSGKSFGTHFSTEFTSSRCVGHTSGAGAAAHHRGEDLADCHLGRFGRANGLHYTLFGLDCFNRVAERLFHCDVYGFCFEHCAFGVCYLVRVSGFECLGVFFL